MYEYTAKVLSVYDGDTCNILLDLGCDVHIKLKCRLYGIDTPELRTKDLDEKKRGYLARDYLRERILNKTVRVKTYKQEKYGRYLVEIFLDDININQELIENGHAIAYFGGKR